YKQTTTIIQNQRHSNQRQSKSNLYPNPTTNPTLSRLPSDQGFCSPTHHGLHLVHTCFTLPAKETETEQICKYQGAGPRPARGVTVCVCLNKDIQQASDRKPINWA